MRITLPTYSI